MKHCSVRFLYTFILFISVPFLFVTCKHTPAAQDFPAMCFNRDILPIFLNNCTMAGCHDGTGESEHIFNSYASIMYLVQPGNPDRSGIYRSITGGGEGIMPPNQPLSIENRTKIRIWIEQGALSTPCDGQ